MGILYHAVLILPIFISNITYTLQTLNDIHKVIQIRYSAHLIYCLCWDQAKGWGSLRPVGQLFIFIDAALLSTAALCHSWWAVSHESSSQEYRNGANITSFSMKTTSLMPLLMLDPYFWPNLEILSLWNGNISPGCQVNYWPNS